MNWLTQNWRTSLIGFTYIGCNVGALFLPFLAEICPWIDKVLIGGGFLAAADSSALARLNQSALDVAKLMKPKLAGGLFCLALMGLSVPAFAQTVTVDLNQAAVWWNWSKVAATDSDVESFVIRCGRAAGVYSATTPVNDAAARTAPIRSIVNGSGRWFCVVAALNRYGVSGNSNEISFDAGAAPAVPSGFRLQAQ